MSLQETIIEVNHEFTEEEVQYIGKNGVTMEDVSKVLSEIPEDADRPTIEVVIASAVKAKAEEEGRLDSQQEEKTSAENVED